MYNFRIYSLPSWKRLRRLENISYLAREEHLYNDCVSEEKATESVGRRYYFKMAPTLFGGPGSAFPPSHFSLGKAMGVLLMDLADVSRWGDSALNGLVT
ncbi:hypothetical protein NDU88_001063 [Pleurodeles waltl]|uniref:Uncharacterized protein n=1 Tax=Pleurodeles waltl TaxID=8319 RepID=A0AAV7Q5Y6_PLEWA|nr:hypothetical protein NDU88_001063 [Pleurodeles waltl]